MTNPFNMPLKLLLLCPILIFALSATADEKKSLSPEEIATPRKTALREGEPFFTTEKTTFAKHVGGFIFLAPGSMVLKTGSRFVAGDTVCENGEFKLVKAKDYLDGISQNIVSLENKLESAPQEIKDLDSSIDLLKNENEKISKSISHAKRSGVSTTEYYDILNKNLKKIKELKGKKSELKSFLKTASQELARINKSLDAGKKQFEDLKALRSKISN